MLQYFVVCIKILYKLMKIYNFLVSTYLFGLGYWKCLKFNLQINDKINNLSKFKSEKWLMIILNINLK